MWSCVVLCTQPHLHRSVHTENRELTLMPPSASRVALPGEGRGAGQLDRGWTAGQGPYAGEGTAGQGPYAGEGAAVLSSAAPDLAGKANLCEVDLSESAW